MLEELIEKMAKAVVHDPESVEVLKVWSDNSVILELVVAKEDYGRVIGKRGKLADAMRTILAAASTHSRKHVILNIADK